MARGSRVWRFLPLLAVLLGGALLGGWLFLGLIDVPAWMSLPRDDALIPVADVYGANQVGQSFVARWDGLSRVDVFWQPSGQPVHGLLRLESVVANETLFVGEFNCSGAESWCALSFPPIQDAAGQALVISLQAPSAVESTAMILSAWPADAYSPGEMLLNSEPLPLDLVFRPYYRLQGWSERGRWLADRWRVFMQMLDGPDEPGGMVRGSARKLSLLALNVAALSLLIALITARASQPGPLLARWLWLAVILGQCLALVVGVSVARAERWLATPPRAEASGLRGADGEVVFDDLLLRVAARDVTFETDPDAVDVRWFEIEGRRQPVLWAHAFSRLNFVVQVPDRGWLEFGAALSPEAWDKDGDGVEFVITVSTAESIEQVYWRAVDPAHNPDDRRWFEERVALSHYAGQEVTLTLNTYPRGHNSWDWAGWRHPIIVGQPFE